MIGISVICQEIDSGVISFIKNINRTNLIRVKRLVVAPSCKMHILRHQQINNRKLILSDFTENIYSKLRKLIVSILKKTIIKKLLFKLLLAIENRKHPLKVYCVDEFWNFDDIKNYEDIAIIYSLEGLLSEDVIKKFVNGIINIHPAILPDYRGLDASLWALYEGAPLGVTSYVVDKGIDTGSVIKKFVFDAPSELSISSYLSDLKQLKYSSYPEAIIRYSNSEFQDKSPEIFKAQNRGVMSVEKLKQLLLKHDKF